MTTDAIDSNEPAEPEQEQTRSGAEYQLPQDAIDEGFDIPEGHTDSEAIDFCRRVRRAAPAPYEIFWRVRRVVDGSEHPICNIDTREFEEGTFAEQADPGDYRMRCIVKRGGGGVNAMRSFTTARASSAAAPRPGPTPRPGPKPRPSSGTVEDVGELAELRRQNAEILDALRTKPTTPRSEFVAMLPAIVTGATAFLKMFMDSRPSMGDLMQMMDKRSGLGEITEYIQAMRELTDQTAPADASIVGELVSAAMPLLRDQLNHNTGDAPAAADTTPAPALPKAPPPKAPDVSQGARLVESIVQLLCTGASASAPDPAAYAAIISDQLEIAGTYGGQLATVANAMAQTLDQAEAGRVTRWLLSQSPALQPHAEFVGEVEAELRTIAREDTEHADQLQPSQPSADQRPPHEGPDNAGGPSTPDRREPGGGRPAVPTDAG